MKNFTQSMLCAVLCLLLLPFTSYAYVAESILVGTTTRTMQIYIPASLPAGRPLIISMHGSGQDPTYQRDHSMLEEVSDTAKFAVVYPQGVGNSWDLSGTSDIDFLTTIIDTMVSRYKTDRNRVYLSGFSMGGMMTYFAATKMADKIAAFAPISGYLMGGPNTNSSRPIPIIHTHGTGDDVVGFSGVATCINAWKTRNACVTTEVTTSPYPKQGSVGIKHYWAAGTGGVEMVLMELTGKGHWYSDDAANVMTSIEIWNFCKNYALDLRTPTVAFTAPIKNSSYTSFGGSATVDKIVLSATASDPDGTVSSVSFYDGTSLLNTDQTEPFSFEWTNVPVGTHVIKAIVTDNDNRTAENSMTFYVNAPTSTFLVSSGFTSSGIMPTGWTSYDGSTLRVGPQTGLSSGARILQFTGSPVDFTYGLYFRNATGAANQGWLKYGVANSGAVLSLGEGTYELNGLFANWNNPSFSSITMQIVHADNDSVLATRTFTPGVNIGNVASNSFSGSTRSSLWFTIPAKTNCIIRFIAADGVYTDGVINDVNLNLVTNDPLAAGKVLLASALGKGWIALRASADALYAGAQYTNLNALLTQYNNWTSTQYSEIETVAQTLNAATEAMLAYKLSIDATERQEVVFQDQFSVAGGGVLPKGWRTYDSSTQRIGSQTGLVSGCRILQFTGTTRDFDHGLYIRNVAGTANMGFAKFASKNCDSTMTLTPGKYTFKYKVCNWNMSSFGAITAKIATREDSVAILTNTLTPTANIGNSVANNFSGSTSVELNFNITTTGNYAIEFYTAAAGWADAVISNISLTKTVYLTSIKDVKTGLTVKSTQYFSLSGIQLKKPTQGLYIEKTTYSDGSIITNKIMQK